MSDSLVLVFSQNVHSPARYKFNISGCNCEDDVRVKHIPGDYKCFALVQRFYDYKNSQTIISVHQNKQVCLQSYQNVSSQMEQEWVEYFQILAPKG